MSARARAILFSAAALCFGLITLIAMQGLPPFGVYRGPYGDLVMQKVVDQRHTRQSVAAVTFDYRGFDTMGEEFIFFAAVSGVLLLLRKERDEAEAPPQDEASDRSVPAMNDAVRAVGTVLFPFTFIFGIYIVLHGHLSPGGGFQGGVIIASAFYFIYLTRNYEDLEKVTPPNNLEALEAAGAGAFVMLGLAGILAGGAFMENILPLGKTGELLSAGGLPLFNLSVGLEVASGFLLIISGFLRQVLIIRRKK